MPFWPRPLVVLFTLCCLAASCERAGTATAGETVGAGGEGAIEPLPGLDTMTKRRGMTFAHEGYTGDNGYGGSTVPASLDSLQRIGVNAIAIVPYTATESPQTPHPFRIMNMRGGETDSAVAATIREAHARSLAVLLKPQIWVRGPEWTGDIGFETDADWRAFFGHYGDWILHYAEIAEREHADALCLGTELVRTTLERPADWEALIDRVRAVYSGKLTYAANWGAEFEQLAFWRKLDAVGLNAYYPLAASEQPSDAQLLAGARRWMRVADSISAAAERPLWLTEVGYRSVAEAWRNPHAAADGRSADEACQARCYAAMLGAAGESRRLTGMFVWKWPSYLGHEEGGRHGGGVGAGFYPGGKPAAVELAAFYEGWE